MRNRLLKDWKRLLLSALCALVVLNCIYPAVQTAVGALLPERSLEVEVTGAGENGGSEVWITTGSDIDLAVVPAESQVLGWCEYRLAIDYGYGNNFLISYGENVGTVLNIRYRPGAGASIQFWKNATSGAVTLRSGSFNEHYVLSTAPGQEQLMTVSLPGASLARGWTVIVLLVLFLALTVGSYMLLRSGHIVKKAEAEGAVPPGERRDASIDLIRCVGALLVVSVHSFLSSGYYNTPLEGEKMLLLTYVRWICANCNSLFLLLTGFLCKNRTLAKRPYRSLCSIVLTFIILTGLRVLVIDIGVLKTVPSLGTLAGYFIGMDLAWYFEMYIGLALLIPFLNMIWAQCSRHHREVLIFILLFISSVFSVTKNLLPSFWGWIYPITYYYIGAYLAEYPCRIKGRVLVPAFLALVGLETLLTFTDPAAGGVFNWAMFGGGYNCELHAVPNILSSVLLFLILKSVKVKNDLVKGILKRISPCAFGIYIASVAITDNLVYPKLQARFTTAQEFMVVQPLAVLASFLFAWLLALPVNYLVEKIMGHMDRRIQGTNAANKAAK